MRNIGRYRCFKPFATTSLTNLGLRNRRKALGLAKKGEIVSKC